jgi:hypothetical protein
MSTLSESAKKLSESASSAFDSIKQSSVSAYNTVAERTSEVAGSVKSSLNEFSSKTFVDGSSEFLDSNTIIAKFAFVILVLIVFLFLCNLGIMLIGYFTAPVTSPYLISGTANGSSEMVIKQDPKNKDSVQILRSTNEKTGIEFTWSAWLYFLPIDINNNKTKFKHIFNKGNKPETAKDPTGIASINNAPGVYLYFDPSSNQTKLRVIMDVVSDLSKYGDATLNTSNIWTNNVSQYVDISDIPMQKWFNCCIRLKNKIIDVYINGTVTQRLILDEVPKQNYYDVNICSNGGFNGNLADLHYFNRALSVFEINNIVVWGRNKNAANATGGGGASDATGFPYYLSSLWYSSN